MAPPRPPSTNISGMAFPDDLANVGYHMQFQFMEYKRNSPISSAMTIPMGGSVALPMPDFINDSPTASWREESLTDGAEQLAGSVGDIAIKKIAPALSPYVGAGSIALGLGGKALSATYGMKINPFLVMLYQSPQYKRFKFSWQNLTPKNSSESDVLNQIVKTFRKNMFPDFIGPMGSVMEYPLLVKPAFEPDTYLFKFKACAIEAINIDYTGAGMPAFFHSNAPVAVKLDVSLIEVDLWSRSDMGLM